MQSFDPANHQASLLPSRIKPTNTTPPSDLGSITSFLQTITGLILNTVPSIQAPCTPPRKTLKSDNLPPSESPHRPSPFQLLYESALKRENYGPDILDQLPGDVLTCADIGMTHGDAVRLKRGCAIFWKENRNKRRRLSSSGTASSHTFGNSSSGGDGGGRKKDEVVSYEIRFPEGGIQAVLFYHAAYILYKFC